MGKLTPMMKQYIDLKNKYKEYILFFRLGDFYEMFFEDAEIASRELEITLTGRDCGLKERAPMCGVPYHSVEPYIARLINKGYKVAICEQVENPAEAKGIVKREVVRIITPGTVNEPEMLNEKINNYVMTIYEDREGFGIAYGDISTGELRTTEFKGERKVKDLIDEVLKINPKEIVISNEYIIPKEIEEQIIRGSNIIITKHYPKAFKYKNAEGIILRHFKIYSLDSIGLSDSLHSTISSGALLDYIYETQKVPLIHIDNIDIYSYKKFMLIDKFTRKNLELVETIRGKDKKGTLLWVLDKTCTSMGARTLRKWIEEPLVEEEKIISRLDSVELLYNNLFIRDELKELLRDIYDLERLTTKAVYGSINARDLIALKCSLKVLPKIKEILSSNHVGVLSKIYNDIDTLEDVYQLLEESIEEDPPLSIKEGGIIKSSFNKELMALREVLTNGKKWIVELEERERKNTGIKSLKVGYNKVFGYYIEITKSNIKNAPDTYTRKQTLANSERYIMPELKELENKILGAEEKIMKLEYNLFIEIKNNILKNINRILKTAKSISELDVLQSFAEVSVIYGYKKPLINNKKRIMITNGRHPVVERVSDGELFVPNDTILDDTENRFYIITGPNMAGKSTYLRQVALIVLMAQIGCFIPADEGVIGIVDRIFTRVGASDDLFQGQSTFMVEMSELSNILHNATDNSLIILDEIGRGTSTYDGLSIAWAVVEYISDKNILGAKTLFATHYHELTELEGKLQGVKNYCISVKEVGDDIVFLRKIIRGGAEQSFGIEVAKLAGIPEKVIERSKEILWELEKNDINKKIEDEIVITSNSKNIMVESNKQNDNQINIFNAPYIEVIEELKKIDILNCTPIDAMNFLNRIVQRIKQFG